MESRLAEKRNNSTGNGKRKRRWREVGGGGDSFVELDLNIALDLFPRIKSLELVLNIIFITYLWRREGSGKRKEKGRERTGSWRTE